MISIVVSFFIFHCVDKGMAKSKSVACPVNHFRVLGMDSCHPWISCEDIDDITVIKRLGTGAIKDVFLVKWRGLDMVLSLPVDLRYLEDFLGGVEVLKLLSPSKYIVQFLGYCDKKYALLTEYHPAGNAANFFIKNRSESNSVIQSLRFCHQYSLILNYLHNGPAGRRVFCDSNSLEKVLSQLLVTSDTRLILNDVDALPEVINDCGIKCGHRQLEGTFVAPEQLWNKNKQFSDDLMHGYNEKTDIWKAAAVCEYFLKQADDGEIVRYRLFDIHLKCRNHEPLSRPTSEELQREYSSVIEEFVNHSEL